MYKPRKIGSVTEKSVRDGVRGSVLMHSQDGSHSATNELRKTKGLLDRYDNDTKSSRFGEDRDILQSAINHWTLPAMNRDELRKSAKSANDKLGLKWTDSADRSFDRPEIYDDWYNTVAGKNKVFDSSEMIKTTRKFAKSQLYEKK